LRDRFILGLKFLVSGLLLYILIRKIGLENLFASFSQIRWPWFAAGIGLFTISNLTGAFQWFLLLRYAGISFSYARVLQYYYIGLFFNNFFLSNMGGDVFRLYYITRYGQNGAAALSTVFMDRFFGFTMLTFLGIAGGIYWVGVAELGKIWPTLLALAIIWGGVFVVLSVRRLGSLFHFFLKPFLPEKFLLRLRDVYNLIHGFSRRRKLLSAVLATSLIIQGIRVSIHYIAARALGIQAPFLAFMVFVPLIALLASLPISIGGLGVREQSGVFLFRRVGIAPHQAVPMELLAYILTIASSLPGMVLYWFVNKGRAIHGA